MNEFDETLVEIYDRRSGKPGRRASDYDLPMWPFAAYGLVMFVAGLWIGAICLGK